ncbi:MAG: NAD(P)-dependent oxidoreductase [Firmicutes bacterium]|nr:NAD(P)-dependent oxidoreductase [Bacillota bacterium]
MRILVTGGTGVIGSWVTRRLVQMGEKPVVLTSRGDTSLIADVASAVTVESGDVRDLGRLMRIVHTHRIDCIVHFAALMPPQCQADPVAAFEVNCRGTLHVLEAARSLGVRRVVYASAKGVYGVVPPPWGHPDFQPIDEEFPKNPVSVYDGTKLFGEHLGENYRRNYGLEFVSLRFATTYGPGKLARHGPLSIHSKLIENAMLGRPSRGVRGADQRDDMIYMADVAQGVVQATLATTLPHSVYHLGSGRLSTLREVAAAIWRLYPEAEIELEPGLDYLGLGLGYSLYDCSRAMNELGYRPEYDVERGVADYVETMQHLGIAPTYTP